MAGWLFVRRAVSGIIDKDKGFPVDIVYDEVQVSVIIQVYIGGSVGHGSFVDTGLCRYIREGIIPVIEIQIVTEVDMFQGSQFFPYQGMLFLFASVAGEDGAAEFEKISVDKIPANAIGYMNVLPAIVIKICE